MSEVMMIFLLALGISVGVVIVTCGIMILIGVIKEMVWEWRDRD